VGRVNICITVCVNSIQKHRLCLEASNNRDMDRWEIPLPKQNKSALTTSLSKQRGSRRGGGRGGEVEKKEYEEEVKKVCFTLC